MQNRDVTKCRTHTHKIDINYKQKWSLINTGQIQRSNTDTTQRHNIFVYMMHHFLTQKMRKKLQKNLKFEKKDVQEMLQNAKLQHSKCVQRDKSAQQTGFTVTQAG